MRPLLRHRPRLADVAPLLPLLLPLLSPLLLGGCGDDGVQLLVHLAPDEARQSVGDVARSLTTVRVAVDVTEPGVEIAGLPAGAGSETVQYLDLDGDGAREAVYALPWSEDRLPVVAVTASRNAGQTVVLRVEGLDAAGELVAIGGLAAVVLASDTDAVVPFNLLPHRLPPRVIATQPEGGQVLQSLGDLTVTFSRRLELDTVSPETVYLECEAAGEAQRPWYPQAVFVVEEQFDNPRLSRHRARAVIDDLPPEASCRIVASPGILAEDGTPLDQDATRSGDDAFRGEAFTLTGGVNSLIADCRVDPTPTGDDPCPAAAGVRCEEETGLCVTTGGCGECAPGAVCDPDRGQCLEDCRPFGACPDPTMWCEPSGRCSSSS